MELALSVIGRLASRSKLWKIACFLGSIQEAHLALLRASLAGSIFEYFRVTGVAPRRYFSRLPVRQFVDDFGAPRTIKPRGSGGYAAEHPCRRMKLQVACNISGERIFPRREAIATLDNWREILFELPD